VSAKLPVNLGAENSKNGVVQIQGGDALCFVWGADKDWSSPLTFLVKDGKE
jgi:hypothetical protein